MRKERILIHRLFSDKKSTKGKRRKDTSAPIRNVLSMVGMQASGLNLSQPKADHNVKDG